MKNLNKKQDWRIISLKLMSAIFFAFLLTFALSCGRDNDNTPTPTPTPTPNYLDEDPLQGYLTNTGFSQAVTNYINYTSVFEFGMEFSPNVNGKIKAITVKIPDTNTNLRVTIWDATTKTMLRTEAVNVEAANILVTKAITDLTLEKDKKYAITMNGNDWYERKKTDGSNITYPITSGNIKFYDYLYRNGPGQVYPTSQATNRYAGDLSFVFQQTN